MDSNPSCRELVLSSEREGRIDKRLVVVTAWVDLRRDAQGLPMLTQAIHDTDKSEFLFALNMRLVEPKRPSNTPVGPLIPFNAHDVALIAASAEKPACKDFAALPSSHDAISAAERLPPRPSALPSWRASRPRHRAAATMAPNVPNRPVGWKPLDGIFRLLPSPAGSTFRCRWRLHISCRPEIARDIAIGNAAEITGLLVWMPACRCESSNSNTRAAVPLTSAAPAIDISSTNGTDRACWPGNVDNTAFCSFYVSMPSGAKYAADDIEDAKLGEFLDLRRKSSSSFRSPISRSLRSATSVCPAQLYGKLPLRLRRSPGPISRSSQRSSRLLAATCGVRSHYQ